MLRYTESFRYSGDHCDTPSLDRCQRITEFVTALEAVFGVQKIKILTSANIQIVEQKMYIITIDGISNQLNGIL